MFHPNLHVRVRGSGSEAKMLCGAEKYGDVTKMVSVAVPQSLIDITCGNCRRLFRP